MSSAAPGVVANDAAQSVPLVHVSGLTKAFELPERTLEVLRGIHLEIWAGELISLVGKSGVGKSTFLHILGTLDQPTSGSVRYDGQDVFALPEPSLAAFRNRNIGFVFQFHHLLPEFTALENAMMPALIARLPKPQAKERAAALLERVGLADRLSHRPGELSGGEQQRVAVARALVMSPKLVLADEPTGNLDQQTSEEIHSLILELNRESGATFLIATHNHELAAEMKRHLVVAGGQVREVSAAEASAQARQADADAARRSRR